MRVGVYLLSDINPSIGGNFTYYDKLIWAIDNHEFDNAIEVCFVGRIEPGKVRLKKPYYKIGSPSLYKFFHVLKRLKVIDFFSRAFSVNADLCSKSDVRILRKNKVDVLLFPKQFLQEVNNFPFISMNWDAGHKSTFAFPELLEKFDFRENWYQVDMQKALSIFVESEASREEFRRFYTVPDEKLEVIPLFAGGVVDLVVDEKKQKDLLDENSLKKLSFFYYPAQYWAHKNHYNLLLAFKKVIDQSGRKDLMLVFSGSDKGNKSYIQSVINELDLGKQVMMLGFISNELVYTLYKNAVALVMPTFLGPTNMPLLEAQALDTAVLCSDLKGHRETCGAGALYAHPANVDQWTEAMLALLKDDFRTALIKSASEFRSRSVFNIDGAISALEKSLIKLKPVRKSFY